MWSSSEHFSDPATPTPTLPIILLSLIVGFGSGVIGFYLLYELVRLTPSWSAGLTTLIVILSVSGAAAGLSMLHDRRTVGINVVFSCASMFLLLAFIGFCAVVGVLAATLLLLLQ